MNTNIDINHPDYYNSGEYEVIDFIDRFGLPFQLGNTVKYLCRLDKKPGQDRIVELKKAYWYLDDYVDKFFELEERYRTHSDHDWDVDVEYVNSFAKAMCEDPIVSAIVKNIALYAMSDPEDKRDILVHARNHLSVLL